MTITRKTTRRADALRCGSRPRLLAGLVAALLILTSCWGGSSDSSGSAPPTSPGAATTGPGQPSSPSGVPGQLSAAWEAEAAPLGILMGVAEGLVVLPDLADDTSRMRLLSWTDGSEQWAVDITKDLGAADFLEEGPTMPPGQVAIWAHEAEAEPSLLVYDVTDGTLISRIQGKNGHHLAVGESGAIYEMAYSEEESGKVTITRSPSAKEFDTKQWTIEQGEEAAELFWVREHEGFVDFCVDGREGPVHRYTCYMSLHVADGTPVAEDGMFLRSAWVGEILVGLEEGGPLKAFDKGGKELWSTDVPAGYPLGWGEHLLFFAQGDEMDLVALDPRTGQTLWDRTWAEQEWSEPLIDQTPSPEDGPLVMVQAHPGVKTGVMDPATGEVTLVDHGLTEFREAERGPGGTLLISSGNYEALTWTVVRPGEAGDVWPDVLAGHEQFEMLAGRLVARKGDRITLLQAG
ncbi:hypothetical protein EII34_13075 [Arachnia propionica]|uniref:Pyrrolo-quinoline quinone repeat domain-containing protein n=1 Tax=Arachnia propionica TaxID=1750 RepID=A0A3P1T2P4_9ACTN|nr:PQQ-binding-like beta-propeller repeat protein [Arachnia propionica]RRD03731.1 hypothetical protein EII34_13075 [Arachnia propionica]